MKHPGQFWVGTPLKKWSVFGWRQHGKIVIDGTAERLANDPDVREFYLGMGGGGEAKSFKEIKHYKRRKRWLS